MLNPHIPTSHPTSALSPLSLSPCTSTRGSYVRLDSSPPFRYIRHTRFLVSLQLALWLDSMSLQLVLSVKILS
jgi:hypothetical protein